MTINKTSFEKIYRNEHDAKTKERMLLVLNVVYNNIIPAHATKDLHRSRAWASDWLKRYDKEGIDGLKDRTKSGRPTEIPEDIEYQIKKELSSLQTRMDNKTGRRVNHKEKRYQISLYSYISYPS